MSKEQEREQGAGAPTCSMPEPGAKGENKEKEWEQEQEQEQGAGAGAQSRNRSKTGLLQRFFFKISFEDLIIFTSLNFSKHAVGYRSNAVKVIARPGSGASQEAFELLRAHFVGCYGYLAEDTLVWAKIDAPVTEHYHLP